MSEYKCCNLCARRCGVNRTSAIGFCGVPDKIYVARAALHKWEEPVISGEKGSGAIFFSGCSLRCVYCQNGEISRGQSGEEITVERLSQIMLELRDSGAHNVNLVTPTHYAPSIIDAVKIARSSGLNIPIVYNTSSYDTTETIRSLSEAVDVYLPDLKYYRSSTAKKYSNAEDYPSVARCAIAEMVRQTGPFSMGADGTLKRGVIARIMLLPGHLAEAKLNLKHLFCEYGHDIYISLMSQYTPVGNITAPLNRRVTREEYFELCEYAYKIGLINGFTQELESAKENFIPRFDNSGVLPCGR